MALNEIRRTAETSNFRWTPACQCDMVQLLKLLSPGAIVSPHLSGKTRRRRDRWAKSRGPLWLHWSCYLVLCSAGRNRPQAGNRTSSLLATRKVPRLPVLKPPPETGCVSFVPLPRLCPMNRKQMITTPRIKPFVSS
jgi:hypothetical protein